MKKIKFEKQNDERIYLLIIYDISDNKRRTKLAKELEAYGERVQLSAFEFFITPKEYNVLIAKVNKLIKEEDSIKIYPLSRALLERSEERLSGTDVFIA